MALLAVDLNEQLLEDFRRFAVNKHGKIYGVLKREGEHALRSHLTTQEARAATVEGDA